MLLRQKKMPKLNEKSPYVIKVVMGQCIKVYIDKDEYNYNLVAVYSLKDGKDIYISLRIDDFSTIEEMAMSLCKEVLSFSLKSVENTDVQKSLRLEIMKDPTKSMSLHAITPETKDDSTE